MKISKFLLPLTFIALLVVQALFLGSCTKEIDPGVSRVDTIIKISNDTIYKIYKDTIIIIINSDTTITDIGNVINPVTEGNAQRPTDWAIPENKDFYPSAMYFVFDSNVLPVELEKGDLFAAFIGGVCHGVAEAETGTDGYTRCSLKVNLFVGEENSNELKIEIKFYSAKFKRIFTSSKILYEDGAICGQLYDAYKTNWTY